MSVSIEKQVTSFLLLSKMSVQKSLVRGNMYMFGQKRPQSITCQPLFIKLKLVGSQLQSGNISGPKNNLWVIPGPVLSCLKALLSSVNKVAYISMGLFILFHSVVFHYVLFCFNLILRLFKLLSVMAHGRKDNW